MKILVTGGAGFVGSEVVALLLIKGYEVRVFDNLRFGGDALFSLMSQPGLEVIVGDVRNKEELKKAQQGVAGIIHLAAIVGYPACDQEPELAVQTNVYGTRNVVETKGKEVPLIFASTGSNYGVLRDQKCKEDSALNPLTTYGTTKTEAEKICLDAGTVALRFATGYGLSRRLRLDLMPNAFVYHQVRDRHLVIYEADFRRTFIHVRDMANAFLFMLENYSSLKDQVFNIGNESMNLSKKEIALAVKEEIQKKLDFTPYIHFAEFGKDADQRNYEVDYSRINNLGFSLKMDFRHAIQEMIDVVKLIKTRNPYCNV